MIDTGGPAFPVGSYAGMTLRDWLAGMAMQGLLAGDSSNTPDVCAEWAYKYADAMLAEKSKP